MDTALAINEARERERRIDDTSRRLTLILRKLKTARELNQEALIDLEAITARESDCCNRLGPRRSGAGMDAAQACALLDEISEVRGCDDREIAEAIGLSAEALKTWRGGYIKSLSYRSAKRLNRFWEEVMDGKLSTPVNTLAPTKTSGTLNGILVTTDTVIPESRIVRLLIAARHFITFTRDELMKGESPDWERAKFIIGAAVLANLDHEMIARFFNVSVEAVKSTGGPGLNRRERDVARRILEIEVKFMADHGRPYE